MARRDFSKMVPRPLKRLRRHTRWYPTDPLLSIVNPLGSLPDVVLDLRLRDVVSVVWLAESSKTVLPCVPYRFPLGSITSVPSDT